MREGRVAPARRVPDAALALRIERLLLADLKLEIAELLEEDQPLLAKVVDLLAQLGGAGGRVVGRAERPDDHELCERLMQLWRQQRTAVRRSSKCHRLAR